MLRLLVLLLSVALPVFPVAQVWAACCPTGVTQSSAGEMVQDEPCHDKPTMMMGSEMSLSGDARPGDQHSAVDHCAHGADCCHVAAGLVAALPVLNNGVNTGASFAFTQAKRPEPDRTRLLRPPSIC